MSPLKRLLALALLSLAPPVSAQADAIGDQIQAAAQAYEAGAFRKAVQTLQFAAAAIREKINQSLLQLLPEPLAGWEADAPESAASGGIATMILGTSLSRRYYRGDGATVEIRITADSPFLPLMGMMLSNPILLQSDPDTQLYSWQGYPGLRKRVRESGSWEISLLLKNRILIQVSGTQADRQTLETYLKALDFSAIERAFSD